MRIENVKKKNADIHFNLSLQCIKIAFFVVLGSNKAGMSLENKQ